MKGVFWWKEARPQRYLWSRGAKRRHAGCRRPEADGAPASRAAPAPSHRAAALPKDTAHTSSSRPWPRTCATSESATSPGRGTRAVPTRCGGTYGIRSRAAMVAAARARRWWLPWGPPCEEWTLRRAAGKSVAAPRSYIPPESERGSRRDTGNHENQFS